MLEYNRFAGCLAGLAAGDALGTTVEFSPPGTFAPLTDMNGGGVFGLKAGQWTDDTSMALCLAESLIKAEGFDPQDQMDRYVKWFKEGHLSSTGVCFDIGNATRTALAAYLETGEPYSGSENPRSAGNGSIMRLAPVPMFYASAPEQALSYAEASSRTTHAARECLDACRLLTAILLAGLHGWPRERILAAGAFEAWLGGRKLSPRIHDIYSGSYLRLAPPDIRGTGYVAESLEAALWAFAASSSFEEGALLAVNLGDDADTTGAVYGQIAGAYYGWEGIPERWRHKIAMGDLILEYASRLYQKGTSAVLEK